MLYKQCPVCDYIGDEVKEMPEHFMRYPSHDTQAIVRQVRDLVEENAWLRAELRRQKGKP
jgi:regulator of replication initiation timing